MATNVEGSTTQSSSVKNDALPNCFISSPFEGVYGRFTMYENQKNGKTYKNFSLQVFNGKQFKTKKGVPYTSMLMSISGAKKLLDELTKAIEVFEASIEKIIQTELPID